MAASTKPKIAGSRALYSALRGVQSDMKAAFTPAVDRIRGILVSAAASDGTIDPRQSDELRAQIGNIVQRLYVGANGRSAFEPDGEWPLSPYARVLNDWLAWVQAKAVQGDETYIGRMLRNDPDLRNWLASWSPVGEGEDRPVIAEARSNPLAQYEPAHTWVDPNGYTLSRRIWRSGQMATMILDGILEAAIREGTPAIRIAKLVEGSLLPGRKSVRTRRPYNRDASFDAMRLARTEIARAHSEATFAAARGNPFVTGMEWKLSASHPRVDICDNLATIGMSGERIREPYDLDRAKQVVKDSHPQCICTNFASVTQTPAEVVAELRAMMESGQPPPPTPFSLRWFLQAMLGSYLLSLVWDRLQN